MREDYAASPQAATAATATPEAPPSGPASMESAARGPETRPSTRPRITRRSTVMTGVLWVLRLVAAAALAVDAYVHADLAPSYDFTHASISQGTLFRVEAGAASLAALLLIVAGRRTTVWVLAFLVAAGGLAAVLLYRYVDVGAFGPFPNMYEPLWYAEKTRSAIAEAIGTGTALAGFLVARHLSVRGRGFGVSHRRGHLGR
jgi:hypothetical protein